MVDTNGRDVRAFLRRPDEGASLTELLVAGLIGVVILATLTTLASGPLATLQEMVSDAPRDIEVDTALTELAGVLARSAPDLDGTAVILARPDLLIVRSSPPPGTPGATSDGPLGITFTGSALWVVTDPITVAALRDGSLDPADAREGRLLLDDRSVASGGLAYLDAGGHPVDGTDPLVIVNVVVDIRRPPASTRGRRGEQQTVRRVLAIRTNDLLEVRR